jgi:hypothetical protein
MRRASLAALATATLCVLPAVSSAQVPSQDSVTLSGTATAGSFTSVTLDATSGPSGESPSGEIRYGVFGGAIQQGGPVTCLAVTGSTAILTFTDQVGGFGSTKLQVVDGQPDTFDLLSLFGSPTDCSPGVPSGLGGSVSGGDITVVDAPPLPTSKDQCKNGGWQTFGFKNQGDCVGFVATEGKNPPASRP